MADLRRFSTIPGWKRLALAVVVIAVVAVLLPTVVHAQDFTWEGVWVLQDALENTLRIRIVKESDGSYRVELPEEILNSGRDDWHPPLELTSTVTVSQYHMTIVTIGSYDGTVFTTVEWKFERTDNPAQLRGTAYTLSEHQFSGNELGWAIVDNRFESDLMALCAAREGVAMPVPCMGLGTDFVPPQEEQPADDQSVDGSEDQQPGQEQPVEESIQAETEEEQPVDDIPYEENASEDGEQVIPEDSNLAVGSNFSTTNGAVSPGAQTAAAVGTTGLLAFWFVWEFMTAMNIVSGSPGLPAYPTRTGPVTPTPTPTPSPVIQPAGPASQPYTGPIGAVEHQVFDGAEVHAILQALEIIGPDVGPGDKINITRAELNNFLATHPDGHPHHVPLPNGSTVIINSVQGLAFEDLAGGGSGADESVLDFSQGIAIVVEVVKPGSQPGAGPTSASPAATGASQTDASIPQSGAAAPPPSGQVETPVGPLDMEILDQRPDDASLSAADTIRQEQEIDAFIDSMDNTPVSEGSVPAADVDLLGEQANRAPQVGEAAPEPLPDAGQGVTAEDLELAHQENQQTIRRVNDLIDDLDDRFGVDPQPEGLADQVEPPDLPEADMIDGEESSAMDDF